MNKNIQTTENEVFSRRCVYSRRGARGMLQSLHLWSSEPRKPAVEAVRTVSSDRSAPRWREATCMRACSGSRSRRWGCGAWAGESAHVGSRRPCHEPCDLSRALCGPPCELWLCSRLVADGDHGSALPLTGVNGHCVLAVYRAAAGPLCWVLGDWQALN